MSRRGGTIPGAGRLQVAAGLGTVASLLLAGCTGGQEGGASAAGTVDPGMGHVHGLGLDPGTGDVLAATHTGLFRLAEGAEPVRVADRFQDTMGFTVDGDRLLGSGHPDPRDGLPAHLGLIQSADAGETWTALSLQGEADLHALTVADGQVVGWDSISGAVLASDDGGSSWTSGATFDAVGDLAHLPDGASVLVTTADGLLVSQDDGASFQPFSPGPPSTLLHVDTIAGSTGAGGADGAGGAGVMGIDTEGRAWGLTGEQWVELGTIGGPPAAFEVAPDGTLLAATEDEVLRSGDARTWTVLADLQGGDR